ncbi:SH3 domain-containing protein [Sphingobacterium bovistauri]|uniref:SH3 domain-containing protein n=1 Tax=Sphingobacterium bovistauri TaxID=2781959 RepID=A0ABS7Z8E1_9SPHI|nr:hypothetical protein [Sphingobacterium bovistauri]MCA5006472.1 hypothetical protein [Sphingobacterium bovistauri]
MKRILLIFVLTFILQSSYSQSQEAAAYEVDEFNLWNKQIGDTAYVFADQAYLRDAPSLNGKIIDSLVHGTPVYIKSEAYNPSTIRGFKAPWQKISYLYDNKYKEGFIWLGLLDLGHNKNNKSLNFIHGFLRFEKGTSYSEPTYLLEIKCMDNNNLIARNYYPVSLNGQTYTDSKILPNMGLSNLESIHRIGFLGEACGIASTHYYFSWNGQNFETMFQKSSVGDAGVYYYEETILFPSEHNLGANLIIKDIEEGEVIDEYVSEPKYKKTRKREKYYWDGKHAAQVIEMK